MLGVILILTIITTVIMMPIMTWSLCGEAKEADEALEHPERIRLKGE